MQTVLSLQEAHRNHLLKEGFTPNEIDDWVMEGLCSYTAEQSERNNFYITKKLEDGSYIRETDSGLYFPFTATFGQIRLDNPILRDGKPVKYLTPVKASSEAYLPPNCVAITEGIKDARMGYLRGNIPIGAIAGVSHYKMTLEKGCGYTIIFDSDGWTNPSVMLNLINAGVWCNGLIQLLPQMEQYPKGGICEYFLSGYSTSDFKRLIKEAYTPKELLIEWSSRLKNVRPDKVEDALRTLGKLAVELDLDSSERKLIISNAKAIRKASVVRTWIRTFSKNISATDTEVEWNAPLSHNQTIGYWIEQQGRNQWEPKCNFDFVIQSELESDDGGGLVVKVKPQFSSTEYQVILDSKGLRNPIEFKEALQRQLGFQVQVALKPNELAALLADRQYKYRITREGSTKRIIPYYGRQDDGTWVFENVQIGADGNVIPEEHQEWAYSEHISPNDYIPCPVLREQSGNKGLKQLLYAASKVLGDNLNPFYMSCGWVVACLNYATIMEAYGSFPILNLHGDIGTTKSLAIEAAFSLVGSNWKDEGIISSGSISAIYERLSKISCIPLCWDDPTKDASLDEFAKALWNANPRIVRGSLQQPRTTMSFTSNYTIGSNQSATWTRMTRLFFKQVPLSKEYPALRKAMNNASSSFSELIKINYDQETLDILQLRFIERLPFAHDRVSQSFAIVTYYTLELLKLAEFSQKEINEFYDWVLTKIAVRENDSSAVGNSLVDFFEHIRNLEAEDKVGAWNIQELYEPNKEGVQQKYYAIAHGSMWKIVEKEYNPQTYDKNSIKSQVIEVGGETDTIRRFAKSKTDNTSVARRCWLIPASKLELEAVELEKF